MTRLIIKKSICVAGCSAYLFLPFRQALCVVNEISHRIMAKSLDVGQMRITYSDFSIKSKVKFSESYSDTGPLLRLYA